MQNLQMLIAAVAMLAASGVMAVYEWTRIRAGRPLMAGSQVVVLYWIAYLALFVLGITTVFAAVLR